MDPKQISNSIKAIINNKSYGVKNSAGTNALLKACVTTLNSLNKKNVSIQPVNNKKNNVIIVNKNTKNIKKNNSAPSTTLATKPSSYSNYRNKRRENIKKRYNAAIAKRAANKEAARQAEIKRQRNLAKRRYNIRARLAAARARRR